MFQYRLKKKLKQPHQCALVDLSLVSQIFFVLCFCSVLVICMDCFDRSSGFRFESSMNMNVIENCDESEVCGVLEIHVHHARNIHNICIYDNQDVYAKFSLTCNPDETLSTGIVAGGGKNPEFDEHLMLKIGHLDAVLKCEIWMLSRARNLMEDQLLGFVLVPISNVVGKGKVTGDYTLSSTDLFHSPAGTVQLSLSLDPNRPVSPNLKPSEPTTSISSEVVLLGREISESDQIEFSRIEFPDINVVTENQKMVSEYVTSKQPQFASFLRLGASSSQPLDHHHHHHHYEMAANSSENSGFLSSTTTSLSDDSNSPDKNHHRPNSISNFNSNSIESNQNLGSSPETPTSIKSTESNPKSIDHRSISKIGGVKMESEEQSAMQQQIVDMYMRSMHQFTESLAKMKLPMDLDRKPEMAVDGGDLIQTHNNSNNNIEIEKMKKKKDGSRVFYGSRAFF